MQLRWAKRWWLLVIADYIYIYIKALWRPYLKGLVTSVSPFTSM